VRRRLEKGKRLGAVNVHDKYAILEIANKLPFPFVHKIVLEEQRLQENSEGAIKVMMSVQGEGFGVARCKGDERSGRGSVLQHSIH
jgi:hypothetical protein